ncbi:nuclease-related domain-containing protein [Tuberibacillus sp. Marseille-P3662]|uniref:nuclease-related domain-containing protein n=1 Tax=Tuberibacillus sp. Marseille-P3662 TaxID=1965358 RepID=UPI000A1C82F8|nr:nuclease-related domain-containing protein [Tuberibacillus sp. Marseille-P3662]
MIVKKRSVPLKLEMDEALLRRLVHGHVKRQDIQTDATKRSAGYRGEMSLDYYLDGLPQTEYRIFNDLRLPARHGSVFQIDTLVLSKFFALIIEVKNIAGTLFFDTSFHQLIRSYLDKEEGFIDPLSQVERHKFEWHTFLHNNNLTPLPIETLVSISNPKTILKTTPNNQAVYEKVIHNEQLLNKINELKTKYHNPVMSSNRLDQISECLLQAHQPPAFNILETYGIDKKDIRRGVQCPNCGTFAMKRIVRNWYCPFCQSYSKAAHEQAIRDYLLLIHPFITNQACCQFLHIPSRHVANRILNSMNLCSQGSTKGRHYYLPKNG